MKSWSEQKRFEVTCKAHCVHIVNPRKMCFVSLKKRGQALTCITWGGGGGTLQCQSSEFRNAVQQVCMIVQMIVRECQQQLFKAKRHKHNVWLLDLAKRDSQKCMCGLSEKHIPSSENDHLTSTKAASSGCYLNWHWVWFGRMQAYQDIHYSRNIENLSPLLLITNKRFLGKGQPVQ